MCDVLVHPGGERDVLGTVRRRPDGACIAVCWPCGPDGWRWAVADRWGPKGYETDEGVADWPIVGAVPCTPAAGAVIPKLPDVGQLSDGGGLFAAGGEEG